MKATTVKQLLFAMASLCLSGWVCADTHTYDSLNRLTSVVYTNGGGQTFTYDAAGNILSVVSTAPIITFVLSVNAAGTGGGTVASSLPASPAINCGATCSATFNAGTSVTLNATQAAGSTFTGWSGACTGTAACVVTMNSTQSVTANFALTVTAPSAPTLNSVSQGPGSATLNFSPPTNNGGSAIANYTGTCTASGQVTRSASGSGSPITVGGLTGGVLYTCTITVTNGGGLTGGASGALSVTPGPANKNNIGPLMLLLLD